MVCGLSYMAFLSKITPLNTINQSSFEFIFLRLKQHKTLDNLKAVEQTFKRPAKWGALNFMCCHPDVQSGTHQTISISSIDYPLNSQWNVFGRLSWCRYAWILKMIKNNTVHPLLYCLQVNGLNLYHKQIIFMNLPLLVRKAEYPGFMVFQVTGTSNVCITVCSS